MIVTYIYKSGTPLSEEQKAEIRNAKEKEIVYDEDSPKLTPTMKKAFQVAASQRNRKKA